MSGYVIRRLLLLIVTLFLVSVIVFLLVRLIPGDIVDAMIGELLRSGFGAAADLDREAIERALGLDVPVHVQYGRWIGDILRNGNLGVSLRYGRPVTGQILSRIGVTLELGLLGTLIGVLIALPVGVYSAVRQDHIGDYLARTVAIVFIALPPFFVGTLVLLFPAIWWGWAPRPSWGGMLSSEGRRFMERKPALASRLSRNDFMAGAAGAGPCLRRRGGRPLSEAGRSAAGAGLWRPATAHRGRRRGGALRRTMERRVAPESATRGAPVAAPGGGRACARIGRSTSRDGRYRGATIAFCGSSGGATTRIPCNISPWA